MKEFKEYSKAEQWALKNEICDKATDDQINYFLKVCESKGVDPFSGRLYGVVRGGKYKVSATIDEKRRQAASSGEYAGSDEPEYDSEDGPTPNWVRVTVYRMAGGIRRAFTAKIRYKEFAQNSWKNKEYHMSAIAAEAQALRKAFPDLVSDDGGDWESEDSIDTTDPTPENKEHREAIMAWQTAVQSFGLLGFTEPDMFKEVGITSREQVTMEHIAKIRELYRQNKELAVDQTVRT